MYPYRGLIKATVPFKHASESGKVPPNSFAVSGCDLRDQAFFRGASCRFGVTSTLTCFPAKRPSCTVELITAAPRLLQNISLVGETIYSSESTTYSIARPPL